MLMAMIEAPIRTAPEIFSLLPELEVGTMFAAIV
jgi:hypothetical protein